MENTLFLQLENPRQEEFPFTDEIPFTLIFDAEDELGQGTCFEALAQPKGGRL